VAVSEAEAAAAAVKAAEEAIAPGYAARGCGAWWLWLLWRWLKVYQLGYVWTQLFMFAGVRRTT
jgi:hypothetical protein